MEFEISPVLFYLVSFTAIFGGLMMVFSKKLFHAALYMALSFFGIAGVYGALQMSFIAVIQIIVYVGAITILIIFGIMLTQHHTHEVNNPSNKLLPGAAVISVGFAILVSVAVRSLEFMSVPAMEGTMLESIGFEIFGLYLLPTEIAAMLLLATMIGAIMVARKGEDTHDNWS